MMKRLISLTVCLTTALLSFAHDFEMDGIYYNYIISGANVTGVEVTNKSDSYGSYTGSVTIPSSVNYGGATLNVKRIGHEAFRESTRLTSVSIPNSVTSIGASAFHGCSSLTSITIPSSVTFITAAAFQNCIGLTSITIPNSMTTIGQDAFRGCSNLASITIPNSVTDIGNRAFLGTVWYNNQPNGMVYAGKVAYVYKGTMSQNTNIALKEGTVGISPEAFYGCSGLTSITIPNSVINIGNNAFRDCSGLASITIPNSVTRIDDYAFYGCSKLTEVYVGMEQPLSIGSGVFSNRANAILYVPAGRKSAYQSANYWKEFNTIVEGFEAGGIYYKFNSSPAQTVSVTFKGDSYSSYTNRYTGKVTIPSSVTYNGKSYSVTGIGNNAFFGCSGLTSVTIPSSVTGIGQWAFSSCSGLTSVTIPSGVTEIGDYAFYKCSGLKSVTIPSSVTKIDYYAFQGCSGLTTVTIPNGVTYIGNGAFKDCTGMTSVTIPSSVKTINSYAFDGCSSLTSVTVGMAQPVSINSNVFSNKANATLHVPSGSKSAYQSANYWKEFKEIIDSYEFYGLYFRITSVTDRTVELTYKGDSYSSYADEYTGAINIPSSVTLSGKLYTVTAIGESAFAHCSGLTSVTYPSSVTSIGRAAFEGCSGLTSITISSSVTSIGNLAFYGCTGLTSVTIPNSVKTIGQGLFYGCSGLKSVTIPNSVTSISASAFRDCSRLSGVTIPYGVTSIDDLAFYGCSGLTSVTIPSSVTSINDRAFGDCSSLTSVTVEIGQPISIYSNVFSNRTNATLYVPVGCKSAYENANYWKEFKQIVEKNYFEVDGIYYRFTSSSAQTVEVTFRGNSHTSYSNEYTGDVNIPSSVTFGGKTYSVTGIGNYAFYQCSGLTSVTIPNGVTKIGNYAFSYCSGLLSVTIPSSVTSIGSYVFDVCSKLTSVYVGMVQPISIGSGVFPNRANATLYVPVGSKSAYEAADYWKEFKKIVEIDIPYVVGDINGDNVVDILDYTGVGNYIHGNAPEGFNEQAADVDKNGIIDILDYTGVANIIHTGNIFGN